MGGKLDFYNARSEHKDSEMFLQDFLVI